MSHPPPHRCHPGIDVEKPSSLHYVTSLSLITTPPTNPTTVPIYMLTTIHHTQPPQPPQPHNLRKPHNPLYHARCRSFPKAAHRLVAVPPTSSTRRRRCISCCRVWLTSQRRSRDCRRRCAPKQLVPHTPQATRGPHTQSLHRPPISTQTWQVSHR